MSSYLFACCLLVQVETVEVDLLIVGGSESATAAAVQAARLGVPKIALVNDIDWLGGQFTSEGLGAVDEWTQYQHVRAPFPRSGMFLEMMELIELDRLKKYGVARPGNCFCAWTTCEPSDTEKLFRQWMAPHLKTADGPIQLWENWEPARVLTEAGKVTAVEFVPTGETPEKATKKLTIKAKLTIDASDWGDVIRLSGAKYLCGPDLKKHFQEPDAPDSYEQVHRNEMNPLTYCLILRETREPQVVEKPQHYDERQYYGTSLATRVDYATVGWPKEALKPFAAVWKRTALPNGPYTDGPTVYHHRRLVDRRNYGLAEGTETILVNWPLQDYPTYNFPQHLVDELEKTERGASEKNVVEMNPNQRRLVFEDAKRHALGMLYHLQTTAHQQDTEQEVNFHGMKLTDEFGTADRLPKKIYVREGLRMVALYMLREQDIRDTDHVQSWADHMTPDSVFGFQFSMDYHPTRRIFLKDDRRGPWSHIHSKFRNWSTHSDRACFPLRSLVPVEMGGLLAAGKNLGMTSLVQSAVRLHGHGMLAGQASATVAAVCLQDNCQPRDVARQPAKVRQVQTMLIEPASVGLQTPGVLLWPYQDVPAGARYFAAANQLAIRALFVSPRGETNFDAERLLSRGELSQALLRASLLYPSPSQTAAVVELRQMSQAGNSQAQQTVNLAEWKQWAVRLGWHLRSEDYQKARATDDTSSLSRGQFAMLLWSSLSPLTEQFVPSTSSSKLPTYLTPGHNTDTDPLPDLNDPLPFDSNNDNLPDVLSSGK